MSSSAGPVAQGAKVVATVVEKGVMLSEKQVRISSFVLRVFCQGVISAEHACCEQEGLCRRNVGQQQPPRKFQTSKVTSAFCKTRSPCATQVCCMVSLHLSWLRVKVDRWTLHVAYFCLLPGHFFPLMQKVFFLLPSPTNSSLICISVLFLQGKV